MAVLSRAGMGRVNDPTPRSRLPLTLWIASAAFIVYGTTIPFNFVHDRRLVADHLARVTLNPLVAADTGRRVSIPDFVSNVLLFAPFGFFGMWALRRPRAAIARIVIVTIVGLILTVGVETLQLFTVDRTTSTSDVFANTVGGFGGAVAAVVLGAAIEGFLRGVTSAGIATVSSFFPFVVATIVLFAGALEPFDATLDVGSVMPKVHEFLHDPFQFGVPVDEGVAFFQHLLFTSTLVIWLRDIGVEGEQRIAALIGGVVAVGAEAVQLFIGARMPGVWDACVGVAGALAGVATGASFSRSRTRSVWWMATVAITLVGAAMQQLSPFTLAETGRAFQWVPFLNYYAFTTSETVSHSAELLLAYFPLGFALALATRRRRRRLGVVLGVALAIAVPIEYMQQFIGGRFPDVTDVALSVAGAWLGSWTAVQGWRLFDRQMAIAASQSMPRETIPVHR